MATPLPCDNHPDVLAATLITSLESGDSLTLCGDCMVEWARMLVGHFDSPAPTGHALDEGPENAREPDAEELAQLQEPKSGREEEQAAEARVDLQKENEPETEAPGE